MAKKLTEIQRWGAAHKRMKVWRHNSFFGHCRMTHAQMGAVLGAPTTTPEAKALAFQIQQLAGQLAAALKERIDG
jgi:hypothetical protein